MSQLSIPQNDNSRGGFLETAQQTATSDQAQGTVYIMEDTFKTLTDFAPVYLAETSKVSELKSNRIRETREKNSALAHLVMNVKHGMHSIKNRVQRRSEPSEVLAYYELPQSGLLPRIRATEETITLAKKLVVGDAAAVSAGYSPMVNPDVAELEAAIIAAETEIGELAEADRGLDDASKGIATLRAQADELIGDVIDELQFNLRKMDDSSARRIMRRYGVNFKNDSGTDEPVAQ